MNVVLSSLRQRVFVVVAVCVFGFGPSVAFGQMDTVRSDWPPAPAGLGITLQDTLETTQWPQVGGRPTMRRIYAVTIKADASRDQVRMLLSEMKAVVIGRDAIPLTYMVRVPDPGKSTEDIDREIASFKSHAIVRRVRPANNGAGFVLILKSP